jgi:hypothetical protein
LKIKGKIDSSKFVWQAQRAAKNLKANFETVRAQARDAENCTMAFVFAHTIYNVTMKWTDIEGMTEVELSNFIYESVLMAEKEFKRPKGHNQGAGNAGKSGEALHGSGGHPGDEQPGGVLDGGAGGALEDPALGRVLH